MAVQPGLHVEGAWFSRHIKGNTNGKPIRSALLMSSSLLVLAAEAVAPWMRCTEAK